MAAARSGDTGACRRIWAKYAPLVLRLVRAYFGPGAETDDLAQEVFLRVFSRLDEIRDPRALRGFVAAICLGVARNMSRRARIRSILRLSRDGDCPDVLAPGIGEEARQALGRLRRILNAASAEDRSLFVARHVEKMEMKDVAAVHRLGLVTAKRRIARMNLRLGAAIAAEPALEEYARTLRRSEG